MAAVWGLRRVDAAFDPAEVATICRAFDKACATLHFEHKPDPIREALAAEIIELARRGACGADYLCDSTLDSIARGIDLPRHPGEPHLPG